MQSQVKILHQQKDYKNAISSKDPSSPRDYEIRIPNKVGAHTLCGCAIGILYPSTSFCGFMVPLFDRVFRIDVVGIMAFQTTILLPKLGFSFPIVPRVGLIVLPITGSTSFMASSCMFNSFAPTVVYHPQSMNPLRLVLDQNMHTYFNPNVSIKINLVDKCLKHHLCTLGMALSMFQ